MRLTMRTNLAMRTLMFCAVNEGRIVRKVEVAAACDASENHLAQVIHKLAQAGFIRTLRGRTGGLQLRQTVATIRVGEVVRAFEAGLPFTQCLGGHESDATEISAGISAGCPLAGCCRLKCAFADALEAFYASLDRLTLADLVQGNTGLDRLLKVA